MKMVEVNCAECGKPFAFPKIHWEAELAYVARVNAESAADRASRLARGRKVGPVREEQPRAFYCGPKEAMRNECFQRARAKVTGFEGRVVSGRKAAAARKARRAADVA